MTYIETLIHRATLEYMNNGVINLSLIMTLTNEGVDVPALEKQLEANQ